MLQTFAAFGQRHSRAAGRLLGAALGRLGRGMPLQRLREMNMRKHVEQLKASSASLLCISTTQATNSCIVHENSTCPQLRRT